MGAADDRRDIELTLLTLERLAEFYARPLEPPPQPVPAPPPPPPTDVRVARALLRARTAVRPK